jgi:hypothetical protein
VPYLSYYSLSDHIDKESVISSLVTQYALFIARAGIFRHLQEDIDNIMRSSKNENTQISSSNIPYTYFDPKKVWYLYKNTAPELTAVALALLSIVPSEAAVERSFSMQDAVHSKKRNKLSDSTVNAEMFIRFNTRALESTRTDQGNYIELTEDNTEQEVGEIVSLFVESSAVDEQKEILEKAQQHVEEEKVSLSSPVVASTPVDLFIENYILENRVSGQYRWVEHRMNHLAAAAAAWDPPIIDTLDTLKKKIQAVVKARK